MTTYFSPSFFLPYLYYVSLTFSIFTYFNLNSNHIGTCTECKGHLRSQLHSGRKFSKITWKLHIHMWYDYITELTNTHNLHWIIITIRRTERIIEHVQNVHLQNEYFYSFKLSQGQLPVQNNNFAASINSKVVQKLNLYVVKWVCGWKGGGGKLLIVVSTEEL